MKKKLERAACIGLDFDNTIICYDRIFHQVALERGLIPNNTPISKEAIRNYLREKNIEAEWTLLQGHVYGKRMHEAMPFPGLFDFFKAVNLAGFQIVIISHKTKTPYLGPPHDLHSAALTWMKKQRFFDPEIGNIKLENVFFEPSKEEKFRRIATTGCHLFIDDLPEILTNPLFPNDVQRVLFSSQQITNSDNNYLTAQHWNELLTIVQNYFSSYGS